MKGHMRMAVGLVLSFAARCGSPAAPVADAPPAVPAKPVRTLPEALYSITRDQDDYDVAPQKRMVDVALYRRVSPEVLREIALDVKGQERRQYPRTLIWVYLPEPLPGVKGSMWATCHFEPTLSVNRTGMTEEDEAKIRAIKLDLPGKRIGTWLMGVQFGGWLVAILEDNGQLKLAETHGSPPSPEVFSGHSPEP